ncbi:MAG TPA: alkaline phosphatase family protein [Chloroflexota bacterium]|nr:alkaline phosphatase family protein [Chloroflexota bacterium]
MLSVRMRCLLLLVLLSVLAGCAALPSSDAAPLAAGSPAIRYAVVLVLDGLPGSDLRLVPMPHLRRLMQRGATFTNAFVGQELANTPPGHATIGTGMLPKHHGVEGFLWEDPRTHQAYDPTQNADVIADRLEAVISNHHVPTLAGRLHRRFPHAKVLSVAAHKCYASDAMGTADADYILCALIYHDRWVAQAIPDHRPPPGAINNPHWDVPIPAPTAGFGPAVQQWWMGTENRWTVRYALWAFHRIHYPRVLMMNLSETDVLGHFAPNQHVMRYLLREADSLIGRIMNAYRRAGLLGRTDFVITADHGMDHIRRFLPYSVITRALAAAHATPVYVEHDTAAAIGLTQDAKAPAVARNIFRFGGPLIDATYYKVETGGHWRYRAAAVQPWISSGVRAAYVRLADTMAADSGPDVYAVYAPGISSRYFLAHGYPWRAGHLGPQWADQHIPLILSGPGVRAGVVSHYPARLVDIAPTVEYLLGVRATGTDGVVLAGVLRHPPPALRAAQRRRADVLVPIVRALKVRSGL